MRQEEVVMKRRKPEKVRCVRGQALCKADNAEELKMKNRRKCKKGCEEMFFSLI